MAYRIISRRPVSAPGKGPRYDHPAATHNGTGRLRPHLPR